MRTAFPPGVLIWMGLEEPVRIMYDAATDGELARFDAWLRSRPDLDELVTRAAALADMEERRVA